MVHQLSEDDVGKRVEDPGGTAIGYIVAVEGDTPYVEADPDLTDSIRAALGWRGDESEAVPIAPDAVETVTDDAVRLREQVDDGDELRDGDGALGDADEGLTERDIGAGATAAGVPVDADRATDEADPGRSRASDRDTGTDVESTREKADDPGGSGDSTERADSSEPDAHDLETETDLDRAQRQLTRASEAADEPVQDHVDSVQAGIREERLDDDVPPKLDRIEELATKLDELAAEEAPGPVADRIRRSRDHLREYLADRESSE